MPDQWDDWMPSPCSECGGIWDLNAMWPNPRDRHGNVVCPPCKDEIEAEIEGASDGE